MSPEDKNQRQMRVLMELSALITSTLNPKEVRERAIAGITALVEAEAGSLLLLDEETNELFFEVAFGEKGDRVKEVRLKMGQGIAGWVAEHGEAIIVHDPQNDSRFYHAADKQSSFLTRNMVCVPVRFQGVLVGVLQAINKIDGAFGEEDLELLVTFANHVSTAIVNSRLHEELREVFLSTVMALAEALEKRDPYTRGHVVRVKNYSEAIGESLQLAPPEMDRLKLAAILHDIGKIGVRDNILLKQSRLDPEELETMNRHSQFGAEILEHVRQLHEVIPSVRGHHENFDGSGYPDALAGETIPLFARVIAVADTFDSMTTDRPYRKGLSFQTAFAELQRCSGSQFDPRIVKIFTQIMEGSLQ